MKKAFQIILVILGVLIGACLVVFIISNKDPLSLKFFSLATVELWTSVIVLLSFSIGMLLMFFISCWFGFARLKRKRALVKEIAELKKQLKEQSRNIVNESTEELSAKENMDIEP